MRAELAQGLTNYIQSQPQQTQEVAMVVQEGMLSTLDAVEQALETGQGDRAALRQRLKDMEKGLQLLKKQTQTRETDMQAPLGGHYAGTFRFTIPDNSQCDLHEQESRDGTGTVDVPTGVKAVLPKEATRKGASVVGWHLELGRERALSSNSYTRVGPGSTYFRTSTPGLDRTLALMADVEPVLRAALSDRPESHPPVSSAPAACVSSGVPPELGDPIGAQELVQCFKHIKALRHLVEGIQAMPSQTISVTLDRTLSGTVKIQCREWTWHGRQETEKTLPLTFEFPNQAYPSAQQAVSTERPGQPLTVLPVHLDIKS